jgi:hypothetical protein
MIPAGTTTMEKLSTSGIKSNFGRHGHGVGWEVHRASRRWRGSGDAVQAATLSGTTLTGVGSRGPARRSQAFMPGSPFFCSARRTSRRRAPRVPRAPRLQTRDTLKAPPTCGTIQRAVTSRLLRVRARTRLRRRRGQHRASSQSASRQELGAELADGKNKNCPRWRSTYSSPGALSSSLGKGITASSLGRLLKARGCGVTMQKLDPYINVDPAR